VLTSTPAEALAVAVRSLLAPLRLLRVPVSEIGGWQLSAHIFEARTANGRRLVLRQRFSVSAAESCAADAGGGNRRLAAVCACVSVHICWRLRAGETCGVDGRPSSRQGCCGCCWLLWQRQSFMVSSPSHPVHAAGLTLLLSLRFMAVAFEEIRNLALGVAARGVQWPTLGPAGGIRVSLGVPTDDGPAGHNVRRGPAAALPAAEPCSAMCSCPCWQTSQHELLLCCCSNGLLCH
jgi:hypothetical protein